MTCKDLQGVCPICKQSIDEVLKVYIVASACQICCDREVNGAFYKCGHAYLCYECARKKRGDCLMCGSQIREVLKIYR